MRPGTALVRHRVRIAGTGGGPQAEGSVHMHPGARRVSPPADLPLRSRLEGKIKEEGAMADANRQELHTLVDHIPESDLPAARKILRALMDPVELTLLTAPLDDEPETEGERAAVERALAEPGPGTPHEEVLREFGL
jgi:hypothetical protein